MIIYSNNHTIETVFPRETYNSYLEKIGCKDGEKLNDIKMEIIFAFAYRDFKYGKLSLDNFSDISNCLWQQMMSFNPYPTRFANVLYDVSELNYYVRNIGDTFVWFMQEVDNYFTKDRPGLLDSLKQYDK